MIQKTVTLTAGGELPVYGGSLRQLSIRAITAGAEIRDHGGALIMDEVGIYNFPGGVEAVDLRLRGSAGASVSIEARTDMDMIEQGDGAGRVLFAGWDRASGSLGVSAGPIKAIPWTIAGGGSDSGELDLRTCGIPFAIGMSAGWTAADIAFSMADAPGFAAPFIVYAHGVEVTVPAVAGAYLGLDDVSRVLAGARLLKIHSGISTARVLQVAPRTGVLWVR